MASTCSVATISMASQGQPSRKAPPGPWLTHFLQPMQSAGSTSMVPKGGGSSSATQYMQSSTGQYATQAGDPAHPVQHSVMTAISLGRFLRGVAIPTDLGSLLTTAVDMPGIITQRARGNHARSGAACGGLATRRLRAQATGGRLFSCPTIEHSYAVTVLALSPDVGIRLQADVS